MGYVSRLPDSNDPPPQGKSKWLEVNEFDDEFSLLVQGRAKRCTVCKQAVRNKHLDDQGRCPDCR